MLASPKIRLRPFSESQPNTETKGIQSLRELIKTKGIQSLRELIKLRKLREINSLKSLDGRGSPDLGRTITRARVPTTAATSVSLLEQWRGVIKQSPRKRGVYFSEMDYKYL